MTEMEFARDDAVEGLVKQFALVAEREIRVHGNDPEIGIIFTQAIIDFIQLVDKMGFYGLKKSISEISLEI